MEEQYLSAAEVGKYLGISYRNLENWAYKGHISRHNRKYGLISALQYQNSQLVKQLSAQKSKLDMNELKKQKLQADVDTQRASARIKNLEADKLEETLVDATEVAEVWKNFVLRCRAKMLSLPTKLAIELAGINNEAEIEQIWQKTIDEALAELSTNHTGS